MYGESSVNTRRKDRQAPDGQRALGLVCSGHKRNPRGRPREEWKGVSRLSSQRAPYYHAVQRACGPAGHRTWRNAACGHDSPAREATKRRSGLCASGSVWLCLASSGFVWLRLAFLWPASRTRRDSSGACRALQQRRPVLHPGSGPGYVDAVGEWRRGRACGKVCVVPRRLACMAVSYAALVSLGEKRRLAACSVHRGSTTSHCGGVGQAANDGWGHAPSYFDDSREE